MNLKHTFTCILFSVSCAVFAQLQDTVSVKSNAYYANYFTDLINNPILYAQFKIKDFTATSIAYQHKQLNFKRQQTASEINNVAFRTQGIYNYSSRLRVFGDFSVTKSLEKNVGFNLSSQRTENQMVLNPNYYYVPKAGNWDTQRYNILGGINYAFNNGVAIGTVLNYKADKLFRKIDPRPEIVEHTIGGKAFVGYTLNQKHTVQLFGGLSQNTLTNSIVYVNDYYNSPIYEDTYVRFNSGFGYTSYNYSYDKNSNRGLTKSSGIAYQYKNEKHVFAANYSYSKLLENLYAKIPGSGTSQLLLKKENITHKYRAINHAIQAKYIFNGSAVNYFAQAGYQLAKNDNFNVTSQGQNFRYVQNRFTFDNGIIKTKNNKTLYAVGLGAVYSRNVIKDLLTVVDKRIHYLEVALQANTDVFKNEKNRLNAEVFVVSYTALQSKLDYLASGSNSAFSEKVIFNDQGYDATTKLTTGTNLTYDIQLKKSYIRIFANYQSLLATGQQYKKYTNQLLNKPNKQVSVGLAIIY